MRGGKQMAERISSLVLIVVSVYVFWGSLKYGIGTPVDPGSGLMPMLASLLVFVLSSGLLLKEIIRAGKHRGQGDAAGLGRYTRPAGLVAGIVAYSWLLELFGFITVTFLLLFLMFSITEPHIWRRNLLISAVITLASFAFFRVLQVDLPIGIFHIGW
jgi:putative tricarboxylic transport membrane protein